MTAIVTKNWAAPDTAMTALQKAITMDRENVIELIEASGLSGRGGAYFPAAVKWRSCAEQSGDHCVVVNFSNCDNANLIPDSIIKNDVYCAVEGLFIAAYTVRANHAVIFLRSNQAEYRETIEHAVNIAKQLLPSLDVDIHVAKSDSEKGQSQIVLKAIEHGVPITECGKQHASVAGLYGKPTLYHSVETVCCVPSIILGEYEETKLVQVIDAASGINKVFETAYGTSIKEILELAGANTSDIKAVAIGGAMGALLPPEQLGTPLRKDSLVSLGADFGDLIIRPVYRSECIVDFVLSCYRDSSIECCGRCIYGRLGTIQIRQILQDISLRKGKAEDLDLLNEVAESMKLCCSCNQGKTSANMIISALKHFRDEFEAHVLRKTCPNGVCRGYTDYYIDPSICTGCENCIDICPQKAIEGEADYIHVIDNAMCSVCGKCTSVCPSGAIKIAGSIKPKLPDEPVPVGSWGRSGGSNRRRRR